MFVFQCAFNFQLKIECEHPTVSYFTDLLRKKLDCSKRHKGTCNFLVYANLIENVIPWD